MLGTLLLNVLEDKLIVSQLHLNQPVMKSYHQQEEAIGEYFLANHLFENFDGSYVIFTVRIKVNLENSFLQNLHNPKCKKIKDN